MAQLDDDEDALRWAGDELAGRDGPRLPTRPDPTEASATIVDGEVHASAARPGSAALTALAAVAYLILTVGWIVGTQYTSAGTAEFWSQLLWQFAEFTAIVAAPLWFATTLLLTRELGPRAGWFALGLGVLLPWPVLPLLAVAA